MARGVAARPHAPSSVLLEQGRLRLGSGKAELPVVSSITPGGVILTKRSKPVFDLIVV
ncbi:hypothetical protein [Brevundimonas sp.]|uniref:hypothetical protein n=1 Tax=Brevundimonas sp. TaxID=1871086 RepID=UPI0028B1D422|nr:hypothetical protein [Brevundimonas sp.]